MSSVFISAYTFFMPEKRLLIVVKKYLDDTITPDELAFLFEWINSGQKDEEVERLLSEVMAEPVSAESSSAYAAESDKGEVLEKLLGQIAETEEPARTGMRRSLLVWLSAAAILVLIIGGGSLFLYRAHQPEALVQPKGFDAPPGVNGATLTLSSGATVSLDPGAPDQLPGQQGDAKLSRKGSKLVYEAGGNDEGAVVYNTLQTARGRQYSVRLSDGTSVWLNAGSSIRFPVHFEGNKREVDVTGEVYFDVAQDKARPFMVRSGNAEVTVLGTRFDVMNYTDENKAEITLLEGSVKVSGLLLSPGKQARIDRQTGDGVIGDVDGDRVIAWTRGQLDLNNGDFGAFMRQVSRWYDVDVVFRGTPRDVHIGGILHRDVNLSVVLGYLSENGIHYETEGKTITILP